ncbi:hypothetical protein SDJN02_05698, partial [Cucurbita argyrosperma subsp. argyrosperma]
MDRALIPLLHFNILFSRILLFHFLFKIHDRKSPGKTCFDKVNETFILHDLRAERKEDVRILILGDGSGGIYGGFCETQTESQVVGYEEDLSGMQILIDRVRTWSSMT